jgi:hypothetical protein
MNNPNSQGREAQKEKEPSKADLKGVKIAIDALTNEIKAQRAEQNNKDESKWPKRTAIAAIIYAGITAVILLATVYQAYLTRSNNVVSQRAFIFPVVGQPVGIFEAGNVKSINFNLTLTNSGNTPTRELTFFYKCAPSAEDMREPWVILHQGPGQSEGATISKGPHGSIPLMCTFPFDQIEQIASGKLFVYLLIEVTYKDSLDDSVIHKTQSAFKICKLVISTVNVVNLPQQFRVFDQGPPLLPCKLCSPI